MKIILYTIGCPKCKVLERKLEQKNVSYTKEENVEIMKEKGMNSAPFLEVDGNLMNFGEAVKYVNNMEENKDEH